MDITWRNNPEAFRDFFLEELNRWYDDFVVIDIELNENLIDCDELVFDIYAWNTEDTFTFRIPNIRVSRTMLQEIDTTIVCELLHVFMRKAREALTKH